MSERAYLSRNGHNLPLDRSIAGFLLSSQDSSASTADSSSSRYFRFSAFNQALFFIDRQSSKGRSKLSRAA